MILSRCFLTLPTISRSVATTKAFSRSIQYGNAMKSYEDSSKTVHSLSDAWVPPEREGHAISTYQICNDLGKVINPDEFPKDLSHETILKCYKLMVLLREMDIKLYSIQRHGLISFYMTSSGEEATHFGSAAALQMEDMIFAQYREVGVLMYRGFTVEDILNQCYSSKKDLGKGRQMPVHYGSAKLNFQTISSTLGTQVPNAVGAAYALKQQGKKCCTITYFGDGAASTGDFHAALNFASTLSAPTIFFCRNNRWAISTPTTEQYRGDAIAGRGVAYGVHTIRVDGNDFFAVYNATKKARDICVEEGRPVLIEAMTYRIGHHSTSDESTSYRKAEDVEEWKNVKNPTNRLRMWLENKGLWDATKNAALEEASIKEVVDTIQAVSKEQKPNIGDLFTDVYDSLPKNLEQQKSQLMEHLRVYQKHYPVSVHAKEE